MKHRLLVVSWALLVSGCASTPRPGSERLDVALSNVCLAERMPERLVVDAEWDETYRRCTVDPAPCERKCAYDDAEACFSLGVWAQQNGDDAASQDQFARACLLGHAVACTNYGAGVFGDTPECAVRVFERTCGAGEQLWGCGMLGMALGLGQGVARDPARAHSVLETACDATSYFACVVLGRGYRAGWFGTPSPEDAVRVLQRACEGGYEDACHEADAL